MPMPRDLTEDETRDLPKTWTYGYLQVRQAVIAHLAKTGNAGTFASFTLSLVNERGVDQAHHFAAMVNSMGITCNPIEPEPQPTKG
jgi:hypothetical protein